MSATFKKQKEDFTCGNCGARVVGNGYTNHCPECLWSKHVDVYPGDRKERCGGMMEPVGVEQRGQKEYTILHQCVVCNLVRGNKVVMNDSFAAVTRIAEITGYV